MESQLGCADAERVLLSPTRLCILGGGGYLGQRLCSSLQQRGHFVVLLDLSHPTFPHISIDQARVLRVKGSILDRLKLRRALKGCAGCFHLAGYGMTGGESLNRPMCMKVNYEGMKLVIEECIRVGVSRLVYTSTVSIVFAHKELSLVCESTPYLKPSEFLNAYSESKCLGEKALLEANGRGGLWTCALRLRGIYGPGEIRTCERIVNLCEKGLVMATFRKSSPEALTQFSGAENCVNALVLAEKKLREGKKSVAAGQVYNIVDGGKPVDSWRFWYPLIEATGATPPRLSLPYWLIYPIVFVMEYLYLLVGVPPMFTRLEVNLVAISNTYSIEKAKKDLGYRPVKNHSLAETVEHHKWLQKKKIKEDNAKKCSSTGERLSLLRENIATQHTLMSLGLVIALILVLSRLCSIL